MRLKSILIISIINIVSISSLIYFVISINDINERVSKTNVAATSTVNEVSLPKDEIPKKQERDDPPIVEVENVVSSVQYPSLSVCFQNKCTKVSSETVRWFLESEDSMQTRVSGYTNSTLIPYFQKHFYNTATAKNTKGSFTYFVSDQRPNLKSIETFILNNLSNELNGEDTLTIKLATIDGPSTDGTYAKKYIEIDNSRQRLYAWIDGKVDRVINLSGPKDGFQVYGVFPIVDKGIEPIAPGGLYMPYWMAFHYAPLQNSWYGLHALIWWYDADNNKVYEPLTNIGIRRSAGCIRMLLDEAKYLYEIYERQDFILIHE